MAKFKVGDCVSWNNEGGGSTGKVIKVITATFTRRGKTGKKYVHRASKEDPYFKLKSNKSGYISYHKTGALHKVKCKS